MSGVSGMTQIVPVFNIVFNLFVAYYIKRVFCKHERVLIRVFNSFRPLDVFISIEVLKRNFSHSKQMYLTKNELIIYRK